MKSKKSKKILSCAIAAALVVSAATISFSAFAATSYSELPGYSDNGTTDDTTDDYVQRTLMFDGFDDVSEKVACTDSMLGDENYAMEIQIPADYIPTIDQEGYVFKGWHNVEDGQLYQPGDTVKTTYEYSYLYADWKYTGTKTLYVEYYDGVKWVSYKTIEISDPETKSVVVTAPPALTNSKNTFKSWEITGTDGETVTVQPGQEVEVVGIENMGEADSFAFYAVWEDSDLTFESYCSIFLYLPSDRYNKDAFDMTGTDCYVEYYGEDVQTVKGVKSVNKDTGEYTVTYDKGSELKVPSADNLPKKDGYTFKGWSSSPYGDEPLYKPGDVIPYDGLYYYLYAVYEKNSMNTNTIKIVYNDGYNWTVAKTDEIAKDATSYVVEVPAAITNSKNTFKEWKDADGNTYKPGDKITVTDASKLTDGSAFEFYAVWEKDTLAVEMNAHVVLYNPSTEDDPNSFKMECEKGYFTLFLNNAQKVSAVYNNTTGKHVLDADQTVTIPDGTPTQEGKVFKGWNTKSDGSGTYYKAGDKIPVKLSEDGSYVEAVYLYAIFGESGSTDGDNTVVTGNPGTGDNFNALPYAAAAVVSLGAMAGVIAIHKKRKTAEDAE